ncbi:hypothetical protein D3C78_1737660 [compost metagenome]
MLLVIAAVESNKVPSQSKAIRSKRREETIDMANPSEINRGKAYSGHEAGEFGGQLGAQLQSLARSRVVEL